MTNFISKTKSLINNCKLNCSLKLFNLKDKCVNKIFTLFPQDMASTATEASKSEDEIVIDASTLNHLMYSIGRLKFSMRSLGNMNLVAAFPQEV